MPVEGLPDPAVHKRCAECGQWFEELDGRLVARRTGVLALVDRMIGDEKLSFVCDACDAKSRDGTALVWIGGGVAIVGLLLAAWLLL